MVTLTKPISEKIESIRHNIMNDLSEQGLFTSGISFFAKMRPRGNESDTIITIVIKDDYIPMQSVIDLARRYITQADDKIENAYVMVRLDKDAIMRQCVDYKTNAVKNLVDKITACSRDSVIVIADKDDYIITATVYDVITENRHCMTDINIVKKINETTGKIANKISLDINIDSPDTYKNMAMLLYLIDTQDRITTEACVK